MLLHESRRSARMIDGDIVLLSDQDRSCWDLALIDEGRELVRRAFATGVVGPYAIQAAISAAHTVASSANDTDWHEVVRLYDLLQQAQPSAVVALNRAVAVAMRDGPRAGLELIDAILARGELATYHFAHAAKADLHRRLGQKSSARRAYETALSLARQEPERRFLRKRLAELGS